MDKKIDMENVTEEDLMKEFMRIATEDIKPGELTVNMFMEYTGVTRNRARHLLAKLEDHGVLKMRKVVIGSTVMNAYSPKNDTWKDVIDQIKQE
jgi:hypothetical protein